MNTINIEITTRLFNPCYKYIIPSTIPRLRARYNPQILKFFGYKSINMIEKHLKLWPNSDPESYWFLLNEIY